MLSYDVRNRVAYVTSHDLSRASVKRFKVFGDVWPEAWSDWRGGVFRDRKTEAMRWDDVLRFGKHAGRTAREVLESDEGYLAWCLSVEFPKGQLWGLKELAKKLRSKAITRARWRMVRHWLLFRNFLWRKSEAGAQRRIAELRAGDRIAFLLDFCSEEEKDSR